ncbi:Oidioi.mRNA.OKI2018_I69.XSR.g16040.t1.cds [Oikopleura dioica]|uniref:Oidioi.mRNA.OKI2018_I69.XSR.g16040.t1.cds n=1 Tax=Oikopleura dioica TaxID=34765 RepID=A0ABN7SIQ2_OIKDI|nr:Oidioi.mRNA.OKI2018_I69.XSR.g16040.t1.cds [Oikopleura dioica]
MSENPKIVFECEGTRYQFEKRTVELPIKGDHVKIGRSQGPLKPQSDNAIFDCRVLSRTHAQIRFLNEKFYLKDTGSSNGTFVNGQKLSDSDHEVLTGDVLQFGVDVDSSPRAQTIPCVVCQIKCYLPDGTEVEPNPAGAAARESYSKLATSSKKSSRPPYNHDAEVRRMHEEATQKELNGYRSDIAKFHPYAEAVEKKLLKLEGILSDITEVQAQQRDEKLEEDTLLCKIECLENMLQGDNVSTLQESHRRVCQEKSDLEQLSKNVVRKSYQEKLAAQAEVDQQKITIKKMENESQRKDSVIKDLKKQLKNFALDSTGKALDVLREAVAEKNLGPEELEVFQTLSEIVFPDAFQEPNESLNNFMNEELRIFESEKKLRNEEKAALVLQLKEKEEMLQFKNNEVETVAQERADLVKRLGELQTEQKEMNAAILADVEEKKDLALLECQKKQNLIYALMAALLAMFMFIVFKY